MPTSHTAVLPLASIDPAHEHGWSTQSTHVTSEGIIRYVRCLACGARRVDAQHTGALPPVAITREARTQP